jgi:tetratricopeptide (TPR) repeat protein
MDPTRREFLSSFGLFVVGAHFPVSLMRDFPPDALEALHEEARSLAQRAHGTHASDILREAHAQLNQYERLISVAGWRARKQLHRTAGLTALVGAYAAWWSSGAETDLLLKVADTHAVAGSDPVVRAQVYVLKSQHISQEAHAIEAGSTEAVRLLTAALQITDATSPPILRSIVRYNLAWEYAAFGDTRAAHMELDAAEWEYEQATPALDVVSVADGAWKIRKWSHSARGGVLARLNLHREAIDTSSKVLIGNPLWQTSSMVDIARSYTLLGEIDEASSLLEEAYLLNVKAGLVQRQERIYTTRLLLPDCPSVRHLDSVLR